MTKNKQEKRTFYCSFHKVFHKYLHNYKPSITYQNCLDKKNVYKFKELMTNSELFKLGFKKNWSQNKANYYKSKTE